jgi:hypothetical protein
MNIYIGLVEENIDPRRLGRLKVRVFGVYDQIPTDDIPWSSPFNQTDGKKFHVPAIGKLVSVIFIKDNLYSPYYLDAENYNINLKDRLDNMDDDNYKNFSALLYDHRTQVYSDNDEFKIDYYFNNFVIDKENISLDLKDNNQRINLGDRNKSTQQALFGNHWIDWFDKFVKELLKPGSLIGNSSAPILKPTIDTILTEYQSIRRTFLSNNIFMVDNNEIEEDNDKHKRKYETKTYTHDVDLKLNDINIIETEIGEIISCESANEQNKINDLTTYDADPDDLNSHLVSCSEQLESIRNEIQRIESNNINNSNSNYNINQYNNTDYVDSNAIPPEELSGEQAECDDFLNGIDYSMRISNYFVLSQLTTNAVVSSYRLKQQKGLTIEQIACNLKNLATDVLDPIKEKYPNMMVTSCFRHGNGRSQHYKGQAADLQFSNIRNSDYKEIANWISQNIPHDQLLLEYKNRGTRLPWIHISYNKPSNRNVDLTFFNDSSRRPGGPGLINLAGNYGIPV